MSNESDNKATVGRWFTDFWGKTCNLAVVDQIAAPNMLLQYSLHEARQGRDDIKAFMTDFRKAFPDLNFWGTADLIAEGDYVVGQWEGGGTHTGSAFNVGRRCDPNEIRTGACRRARQEIVPGQNCQARRYLPDPHYAPESCACASWMRSATGPSQDKIAIRAVRSCV